MKNFERLTDTKLGDISSGPWRHSRHHHDEAGDFGGAWSFGHGGRHHHGFGPGMGREFWRMFGGPQMGRRMRRGDVRSAILALLKEGPQNGYGVIQEIERRSDGMWKPSAGAVYPSLQQLEDEGLIEQVEIGGRRQFRLTEAGAKYVQDHAEELNAPWQETAGGPPEGLMGLLNLVRQVGMAAVEVGRSGSPMQVGEARGVLNDARRRLYGILASDEAGPEQVTV